MITIVKGFYVFANGNVHLQNTTINGLSEINGYLHAEHSTLDHVTVSSEKITLSNSKTKSIHIKKPAKPIKQIVELNNTKVVGNIVFEGENGIVLLQGDSGVTGEIVGGTIEKR